MSYPDWAAKMFPSITSLHIADNSQNGKIAIYSLKDREFNLTNIVDDIVTIYNAIELYDASLFFDRYYFVFKDTLTNVFKVVAIDNSNLVQYTSKTINYDSFINHIDTRDIKLRSQDAKDTN